MTRFLVHPYRPDSAGAKKLITALGGAKYTTPYTAQPGDCVISWGAGRADLPAGALNKKIDAIINKVDFLVRLKDTDYIPDFRTTKQGAASLKFPVFCRTILEGKDGEGIVIAENATQLVNCSLYTEYEEKTAEYRVHVGRFHDGTIHLIGSQKKVHDEGTGIDPRIWCGDGTHLSDQWDTAPDPVIEVVIESFKKFPEVTFAGFDVIYNSGTGKAYVLEANTAPMGTPTTISRYVSFFKTYVEKRDGVAVPVVPTPPVAQPAPVTAAPAPAAPTPQAPAVATAQEAPTIPFTVSVSLNRAEVFSQLKADIAAGKMGKDEIKDLMTVIVKVM